MVSGNSLGGLIFFLLVGWEVLRVFWFKGMFEDGVFLVRSGVWGDGIFF